MITPHKTAPVHLRRLFVPTGWTARASCTGGPSFTSPLLVKGISIPIPTIVVSGCLFNFWCAVTNTQRSEFSTDHCTCSVWPILRTSLSWERVAGYGRDQFYRLLFGGQVSLFAGLAAALLSLVVGLIVGGIAGAFGGWVDNVAMRMTEITMAVPSFYLLLTVRAFLPLQMEPAAAFGVVVVAIGFWNWARPARMVRGIVLSGRERNFVVAARGFGANKMYLLRRHLAPMTFSVLLTQMAILIPQFILAEVILSFLGLGIGEPFPSWGNMLAYAQQYHILVNYWWMLLPGVALAPVILAYHALSEAVPEKLQSIY